eukprot:TRINITY_DN1473_c0_g1_i1.p1 TRINITY_DN1473_c0_g1~~TRINITY_DN1473_c0_g1_i1.p1  ORF type:complete len:507 (-),score=116.82 TRINITY_DN1473_c0_g1_i1:46-1566(-)
MEDHKDHVEDDVDFNSLSEFRKSLEDLGQVFRSSLKTARANATAANIGAVAVFFVNCVLFRFLFLLQTLFDKPVTKLLKNLNQIEGVSRYSNVNSGSPQLFDKELPAVVLQARTRDHFDMSGYDKQNSEMFLLLSALAYEDHDNCAAKLRLTGLQLVDDDLNMSEGRRHYEWRRFSIYYSDVLNLVVIAFKGTSPMNWPEWMTDAEMGLMASECFPGKVHTGFFNRLFKKKVRGHDTMVNEIKDKLSKLNLKNRSGCRVWITGHSLGAAMCSLFTAYLIQEFYKDREWKFGGFGFANFKGSYGYGTPRVGNLEFASDIQKKRNSLNFPFYRVIGSTDIVCRVPLGGSVDLSGEEKSVEGFAPPNLDLDYYHFGTPVNLFSGFGETIFEKINNDPLESEIVLQTIFYALNFAWLFGRGETEEVNNIGYMRRFLNPLLNILDHFPSEYYWRIHEASTSRTGITATLKKIGRNILHVLRILLWAVFVRPLAVLCSVANATIRTAIANNH